MPAAPIPAEVNQNRGPVGGLYQRKVTTANTAIAATQSSGSAVDLEAADLTDPPATDAARGVQAVLASGGTPGAYTITGTWDGQVVSEQITTVADDTVKGDQPFDTFTAITGPDPGANLDFQLGDVFAVPSARALWTGATGGDLECQLDGEDAVQVVAGLPASIDWQRRIARISPDSTTIPTGEAWLVW